MSSVKPIPAGHHTVAPYLAIKNGAQALEFYKKAFGATEMFKLILPDGRLGHAAIRLGDSVIMLSDEFPEHGGKAPQTLGGGEHPSLRGERRLFLPEGSGRRRQGTQARHGPVLRGPLRPARGSLRASLVGRHAQRGCSARGVAEASAEHVREQGID